MWRLEWPPGSGRKALYADHEVALVERLVGLCERGEISEDELRNQVDALHILKRALGAVMVEDVEGPVSENGLATPKKLRG